jgi:hypothetical protein
MFVFGGLIIMHHGSSKPGANDITEMLELMPVVENLDCFENYDILAALQDEDGIKLIEKTLKEVGG